jgi:hypothetical protein
MILGIDPGLWGCGCALLLDGVLVDAFYVANPAATTTDREDAVLFAKMTEAIRREAGQAAFGLDRIEQVVIERPQVYTGRNVPSEDLMVLGVLTGALAQSWVQAGAKEISLVVPRRWKKQVPKEIKLKRIIQALSDEEQSRIREKRSTFLHNVIDAVGLAKWYARTGCTRASEETAG